jgi:hypothetical protein
MEIRRATQPHPTQPFAGEARFSDVMFDLIGENRIISNSLAETVFAAWEPSFWDS